MASGHVPGPDQYEVLGDVTGGTAYYPPSRQQYQPVDNPASGLPGRNSMSRDDIPVLGYSDPYVSSPYQTSFDDPSRRTFKSSNPSLQDPYSEEHDDKAPLDSSTALMFQDGAARGGGVPGGGGLGGPGGYNTGAGRRGKKDSVMVIKGKRKHWEPVVWSDVWFLVICVVICWPIGFFAPKLLAQGLDLQISRAIVAVVGTLIGLICAIGLYNIGRRVYEAALFASLCHAELSAQEVDQYASIDPLPAARLLWKRTTSPSFSHKLRTYDRKPWNLFILLFLFVTLLSHTSGFIYGRVVIFDVKLSFQNEKYHPVGIVGDVSDADLTFASGLSKFFDDFKRTWTFRSVVALDIPVSRALTFENRSVYFTETPKNFFTGSSDAKGPASADWGTGFGNQNSAASTEAQDILDGKTTTAGAVGTGGSGVATLVRFPKYGSEVRCQKVNDLQNHFVSGVNNSVGNDLTYVFIPQSTVHDILSELNSDNATLPLRTDTSPITNSTGVTLPSGAEGSYVMGPFFNNGVATSFFSLPIDQGGSGNGWVEIETILLRLDKSLSPQGSFPSQLAGMNNATIGLDVAICGTKISPFLIEAINTTSGVTTHSVVARGTDWPKANEEKLDALYTSDNVTQALTSTGKNLLQVAFANAFVSSRNQLLKDNGRDFFYVANPAAVLMSSWVDANFPPEAYGTLDAQMSEQVLHAANTRFLLPYLIGSARVEGKAYVADQLAYPRVSPLWLSVMLAVVLVTGLIGAFFVPRLPLGLPHRDTSVSSWLLAFHGDGLADYHQIESLPKGADLEDARLNIMRRIKLRYGL